MVQVVWVCVEQFDWALVPVVLVEVVVQDTEVVLAATPMAVDQLLPATGLVRYAESPEYCIAVEAVQP